jgi:L-lysine exporter family protein LysE/ArgO
VVVTCCVVDSVVITFGVVGFGTALAGDATLTATAAWAGTAFLLVYAAERLRSAVGPSRELDGIVPSPTLRRRALATALAVSMLNPQLYLDAFVLMGGVAAPLPHTERIVFAVGALLASSAWFAAFAFAATKLSARCFAGSLWRAVDVASCGCMLMFALAIVWHHDLLPTLLSVIAPIP